MSKHGKKGPHDTIPEINRTDVVRDTEPEIARGPNEGEGNRTAARRYDAGVAATVHGGHVEELAKAAKKALEGKEGDELRRAEAEAKSRGRVVVPPARRREDSHAGGAE